MLHSSRYGQCTLLLLALSLPADSTIAEIYKWVDAQGNVHFGDNPKQANDPATAEEVTLGESYRPTERTPEEQQAYDEQQRKIKLRDQMRQRDEQQAREESQAERDEQKAALCAHYDDAIAELETVKVENGVRHLVYATENGQPVSSERQREMIAEMKRERAKAGCR